MLRWIPSKEHEAELTDERIDITVLDHSGTIAAAKVEWEFQADGTPQSIDYLALAHTKDGWQAVNIVWEDDRRQGGPVIAEWRLGDLATMRSWAVQILDSHNDAQNPVDDFESLSLINGTFAA